jgi:hypothetical protein
MARFHTSHSNGEDLLPQGVYLLRVLEATEQKSSRDSEMIKLKMATIPHDRYVWDYLVFSEKAFWVIADFCRSSGLQLPVEESEVDLYPHDCLRRVCYAELVHERGRDGKTRLAVERYVTRKEALELNPALIQVKVPADAPVPKKLQQAGIALVARQGSNQETEVEPDDIPF